MLKIHDIECNSLPSKKTRVTIDREIDPYVIFQYRDSSKKTKTIDNEENPKYKDVELIFELQSVLKCNEYLDITVKDHEYLQPDISVGTARISLTSLSRDGAIDYNEQLQDSFGRPTISRISFKITYVAPVNTTYAYGGGDDRQILHGELPSGEHSDLKRKNQKRKHGYPNKPIKFQVYVKVIEARHLPGTHINPIVRIQVGKNSAQTRIRYATAKPFFNEVFRFNLNLTPIEFFSKSITFEVYNSKKDVTTSNGCLGKFSCNTGLVFDHGNHSIVRKWLLLTKIEEKSKDDHSDDDDTQSIAAGYLKVTVSILGPGDNVSKHTESSGQSEIDDVQSNFLRPVGTSLQPVTFLIRVYHGEDLPQMDFAYSSSDKVDAYMKIDFNGESKKTVVCKSYQPVFNQELRFCFNFPSICDRVKLQLFDKDAIEDECIGTSYITLSDISKSSDSNGFLPTYGPAFVNFFGSTREYSILPNQYSGLNTGETEGMAYRGRAFVEILTKTGEHIERPIQSLMEQELVRAKKYLRTKKYKLTVSFLSATMLNNSDDPIEFEVSIGNYGNKLDKTVAPQSSSTPPSYPVTDGCNYYILPWDETKPCCVVESHWEDIAFRLEPMNCLERIITKLENNMNDVNLAIKKQDNAVKCADLLLKLLQEFVSDCEQQSYKDFAQLDSINKLDKKLQGFRISELKSLKEDAKEQRCIIQKYKSKVKQQTEKNMTEKNINDFQTFVKEISVYVLSIRSLCIEPQCSMPDIVISMIVGSGRKRIAYYRIPANEVWYSKNENARGKYCNKLNNIILQYPKDSDKQFDVPACVSIIAWLGHEDDWININPMERDLFVYAETYENDGLLSLRPKYSDAEGEIELKKDDFKPPTGWKWEVKHEDGRWKVAPEKSTYDADLGHTAYVQEIFCKQNRLPFGKWLSTYFTNSYGDEEHEKHEEPSLPEGWEWMDGEKTKNWVDNWKVDINRACDEEGWEYSLGSNSASWAPAYKYYHFCRRKRMVRTRKLMQDWKNILEKKREDIIKDEGWEHAPTFYGKFHMKKRMSDFVKRRRWHAKMINTIPGASPTFTITCEGKEVQVTPRIFQKFSVHKWQLRMYIYEARNLLDLDIDGQSDPFVIASFQNYCSKTHIITDSLDPLWNETLLFREIELCNSPETYKDSSLTVVAELWDKDDVGKNDFLGRCLIKPHVRLNETEKLLCLSWYPVMRKGKQHGELLAAAELILIDGLHVPDDPPFDREKRHFLVPSDIRPVVVNASVELVCFGVRNMKGYHPSIELEIGGKTLKSGTIKNTKLTPNFSNNPLCEVVSLPKEPLYMPPVTIKVYDNRSFGRKVLVGSHVIKNFKISKPPNNSKFLEKGIDVDKEDHLKQEMHDQIDKDEEKNLENKMEIDEKHLDWWCKYYASCKTPEVSKAGKYLDEGYQPLKIYEKELEKVFKNSSIVETYPLKRNEYDDDTSIIGEFKGLLNIYESDSKVSSISIDESKFKPVDCVIRVYVIRGIDLKAKDLNGKADPFIAVELLGKKTISDEDNYIANDLNPYFGAFFEMRAKIPITKDLKIKVMDYDRFTGNDLIGETIIDLEDRYLSSARAICGLPKIYYTSGPYKWQERKTPKELLKQLHNGKVTHSSNAMSNQVVINGNKFDIKQFEKGPVHNNCGPSDERLALHILHNKEHLGFPIVPEHIETRSLWNPLQPNVKQGKIEMFVDIFPLTEGPPGPPKNIGLRKPKDYVLRVVVWKTAYVKAVEKEFISNEDMSDIYVKGWLMHQKEGKQKTDVHYRSMDGEGLFNWRMIFPFKYMQEEKSMVIEKKEHFWYFDKTKQHCSPLLNIEVWDQDTFSPNDYIGDLELDLSSLVKPGKKAVPNNNNKEQKRKSKRESKRKSAKRSESYYELEEPEEIKKEMKIDLFKQKKVNGWWLLKDKNNEEVGKIHLELEVMTAKQAEERPAGIGRQEPNMNPTLTPPERPKTSFFWFTSPWKSWKFIIWKNNKWKVLLALFLILLGIFVSLWVYNIPEYVIKAAF